MGKKAALPHPGSVDRVELGFRYILEGLGLDPTMPHLKDTPRRAAHAWFYELCQGMTIPPPEITTFDSEADEMIMLQHIPIRSICAHHLLPFVGNATVAYIPGKKQIIGLSKLSRICNYWARRPQVQEDLTTQIADTVADLVMGKSKLGHMQGGVGVIIRARHMCMELRGVEHTGDMVTSALRGVFLSGDARIEFLRLDNGGGS